MKSLGPAIVFFLLCYLEALASSSDAVGLLIGTDKSVRLYNNFTDLTTYRNVTSWVSYREEGFAVDYDYERDLMYVNLGAAIYKYKGVHTVVDGATDQDQGQHVADMVRSCHAFAVDWVNDRTYWATCFENHKAFTINYIKPGDKQITTVLHSRTPLNRELVQTMEVDPYEGLLFWTHMEKLESCASSGANRSRTISGAEDVHSFTLDLEAKRIYYFSSSSTDSKVVSLYSIDYQGGQKEKHFDIADQPNNYYNMLGMGIYNGVVYWGCLVDFKSVIFRAPLNATTEASVEQLGALDAWAHSVRLIHPDLQKRPSRLASTEA